VENTLDGFFDGAGGAANDASDFLIGQACADSKGGTQLLLSKYAGGALELAEIDNRAHLFYPSHSLLMDKNISRFIEVIKQYFYYFYQVSDFPNRYAKKNPAIRVFREFVVELVK